MSRSKTSRTMLQICLFLFGGQLPLGAALLTRAAVSSRDLADGALLAGIATVIPTTYVLWRNGSRPISEFRRRPWRLSDLLARRIGGFNPLLWPRLILMYVPLIGEYFWLQEIESVVWRIQHGHHAKPA